MSREVKRMMARTGARVTSRVTAKAKGFTLIELMLALTFIAMLLLAISMIIIQISKTYNKGMVYKAINQVSREISADLNRTVSISSHLDIPEDGSDGDNIVTVKDDTGLVVGGRLCTGEYSYIWNTNRAINENNGLLAHNAGVPIRLAKVEDSSSIYCDKSAIGELIYDDIRTVDEDIVQEMLVAGDYSLAINSFSVTLNPSAYDDSTKEALYNINYTIGSGKISAMNSDQTACLTPGEEGEDLYYCSVQKFTIVLRAGNKV